MKILVVNGFTDSAEGKRKFSEFLKAIKTSFEKNKPQIIGQPEYVIRDKSNLDDYLFEVNTEFNSTEAQKLFNNIEFVFMTGECSFLPWQPKSKKLAVLFKMCKRTNKILFAAGLGMQFLVYYCSTGFMDVKVMNPRGSILQMIHYISEQEIANMKRNSVFLDSCTGDYYEFNKELNQWQPIANTGLHHQTASQNYGGPNNLLQKPSQHQNGSKISGKVFTAKLTEARCKIDKHYLHHWVCNGLPQEFIVPNKH